MYWLNVLDFCNNAWESTTFSISYTQIKERSFQPTCRIVVHRLIIEKETTKKVSSLRVLVGGLSRLTRRSSGSEVNREIFPRTTNRMQPDTDFYYSHRTFSRSRRGKCMPTRVTGTASIRVEKAWDRREQRIIKIRSKLRHRGVSWELQTISLRTYNSNDLYNCYSYTFKFKFYYYW